jgi:hypothetical protein
MPIYDFDITIPKANIPGPLTNWPYLFSELTASIPAGFWGHVVDPNGLDIKFFDGATELDREITYWNAGTNKIEAWVNIPALDNTTDKVITCKYGGATRANDTTAWTDANAFAVYHFQDGPFGNADSTGLHPLAITGSDQVPAKINSGHQYNNVWDHDSMGATILPVTHTIVAWAYLPPNPPAQEYAITFGDNYHGFLNFSGRALYGTDGWGLGWYSGAAWQGASSNQSFASQVGSWHRIVGTFDGTNFRIYVDGQLKGTSAAIVGFTSTTPGIELGNATAWGSDAERFLDTLDEIEFYSDCKSDDWAAIDFASQNDPATFASCGPEHGGAAGTLGSFFPFM